MQPFRASFQLAALSALAILLVSPALARAQSAQRFYAEAVQAYQQGDTAMARRQLGRALDFEPNHPPARALLARISTEEKQRVASGAPAPVVPMAAQMKALDRLVVPVDFQNTTLAAAVEFLRQQAGERSGGRLAPNIVLKLTPELANKPVTLRMDNVPFTSVLRYLGDLAGVRFEPEAYAIVGTPAEAAAKP